MLVKAYIFSVGVGLVLAFGSSVHYLTRKRDRSAEVVELITVLRARAEGDWMPLPEHSIFWKGTLAVASAASFLPDSLISLGVGAFSLHGVADRAGLNTISACGAQYIVCMMRKDRRVARWPNSPWTALVVSTVMGTLGGLAEASLPGALAALA